MAKQPKKESASTEIIPIKKTKKNPPQDEGGSVRTVMVAARVLEAFADFRGPVRITDLARALKMTMPRISRHVSTLRALGFIEKAEPTEAYRLGIKLFTLGQIALEQNSLTNVAYPHITHLRDKLSATIILSTGVPDGATVIACIPSKKAITLTVRPGTVMEFPFSPAARICHTFSPQTVQAEEHFTDEKHATSMSPEYLESRNSFILANFYDFEEDTRGTGFGAVSSPIFDSENQIAGALSILLPSSSLKNEPDKEFVKPLKEAAMRISSSMGSTAWAKR